MSNRKNGKRFLFDEEARKPILEGAELMYRAVSSSYGPRGRNTIAEKSYGMPRITRDGVSIARESYLSAPELNAGMQLLLEASERTNTLAGDATTSTIVFGYQLFKHGLQAIAAGIHPMVASDMVSKDSEIMLDALDKLAKPVKKGQLQQVATVSSGDPLIGQLVAEAVEHVGPNGGVNAEMAPVESVEREYVDGMFLQTGFTALQEGKKEMLEPMVIVLQKRVASAIDIGDILQRAFESKGLIKNGQIEQPVKLLLIGNIDAAAYIHAVDLINKRAMDAIILKTPLNYGEMGKQLLEDIAIYAGCEPISESTNLREVSSAHVGEINRAVASKTEATLYGDNTGELVQDRIASIKSQIDNEPVDAIREKLRDRLAMLEGKIAIFRIGGATETSKEELADRIEDAILSTRAAYAHGVVPGGALTWVELSKLSGISEPTRLALREVFTKLLTNANFKAEIKLDEVLKAKAGWGYNLRKSDELVDLVEAGILDPKLAIREAIKNACAFASSVLKSDTLIVFEPDEEKE